VGTNIDSLANPKAAYRPLGGQRTVNQTKAEEENTTRLSLCSAALRKRFIVLCGRRRTQHGLARTPGNGAALSVP
jgi:hypothetical protein